LRMVDAYKKSGAVYVKSNRNAPTRMELAYIERKARLEACRAKGEPFVPKRKKKATVP
jgi:hypothetical protein